MFPVCVPDAVRFLGRLWRIQFPPKIIKSIHCSNLTLHLLHYVVVLSLLLVLVTQFEFKIILKFVAYPASQLVGNPCNKIISIDGVNSISRVMQSWAHKD